MISHSDRPGPGRASPTGPYQSMRRSIRRSRLWKGIHRRFITRARTAAPISCIGPLAGGSAPSASPGGQVPMQRRLLGLLAFLLVAVPAAAEAFPLPEVRRDVQVQGTPVTIVAHPQVTLGVGWGGVSAQVVADVDLGDLQSKLPAILAATSRNARCGERASVSDATSKPAPPAVALTGRVHYEQWACSPMGLPRLEEGHLRLERKKEPTRIASTTARVCLDLTPRIEANKLLLDARTRCIEPEGTAGQVVDRLHLERTLEQLADKALDQALSQEDLTAMLPDDLRPYHPDFTEARFTRQDDGSLGLHLEGTLTAGAADLAALARRAIGG
jgi:hypothetical protein